MAAPVPWAPPAPRSLRLRLPNKIVYTLRLQEIPAGTFTIGRLKRKIRQHLGGVLGVTATSHSDCACGADLPFRIFYQGQALDLLRQWEQRHGLPLDGLAESSVYDLERLSPSVSALLTWIAETHRQRVTTTHWVDELHDLISQIGYFQTKLVPEHVGFFVECRLVEFLHNLSREALVIRRRSLDGLNLLETNRSTQKFYDIVGLLVERLDDVRTHPVTRQDFYDGLCSLERVWTEKEVLDETHPFEYLLSLRTPIWTHSVPLPPEAAGTTSVQVRTLTGVVFRLPLPQPQWIQGKTIGDFKSWLASHLGEALQLSTRSETSFRVFLGEQGLDLNRWASLEPLLAAGHLRDDLVLTVIKLPSEVTALLGWFACSSSSKTEPEKPLHVTWVRTTRARLEDVGYTFPVELDSADAPPGSLFVEHRLLEYFQGLPQVAHVLRHRRTQAGADLLTRSVATQTYYALLQILVRRVQDPRTDLEARRHLLSKMAKFDHQLPRGPVPDEAPPFQHLLATHQLPAELVYPETISDI